MDKITKLSQAIRLGATFRPQCYGHMFHDGSSCALGAAAEAVGAKPDDGGSSVQDEADEPFDSPWSMLRVRFSEQLDARATDNEAISGVGSSVGVQRMIVFLNDSARWTRERIAQYLEDMGL